MRALLHSAGFRRSLGLVGAGVLISLAAAALPTRDADRFPSIEARTPPIRVVDDATYEVERRRVPRLFDQGCCACGQPRATTSMRTDLGVHRESLFRWLLDEARVVPEMRPLTHGFSGLRLYNVRPDSILARLGLRNGDALRTINGIAIDSPEVSLQIYDQLQHASQITVVGERANRPLKLVYRIVD